MLILGSFYSIQRGVRRSETRSGLRIQFRIISRGIIERAVAGVGDSTPCTSPEDRQLRALCSACRGARADLLCTSLMCPEDPVWLWLEERKGQFHGQDLAEKTRPVSDHDLSTAVLSPSFEGKNSSQHTVPEMSLQSSRFLLYAGLSLGNRTIH